MKANNIFKLIVSIAIPLFAGVIGSTALAGGGGSSVWYESITKPALNPPGWVFGPVWTVLYVLMGIAAFLIWKNGWERRDVRIALGAFGIQLFLNTIWSIIFFGLQKPGWALVDIVALWLAIVWTMVVFYKISPPSSGARTTAGHGKLASYLLVPYLLWVSFALYLNYSIWILN